MTGDIRVTPEQLLELSTRVRAGSDHIEAQLRSLTAAVAPLGSDWAGLASLRFLDFWDQWQHSAEQLRLVLTAISGLLVQAANAYTEAENQIAGTFLQV